MKILYLSPIGKKKISNIDGEEQTYNFEKISNIIKEGIKASFPKDEITMVIDLVDEEKGVDLARMETFDLCICDLTTVNPNILYHLGQVEGLKKPIIYFLSSDAHYPTALSSKRIIHYSEASLENEFIDEVIDLIKLAKKDPSQLIDIPQREELKPKAFISYSHKNREYLDRLMVHLKPLAKQGLIDIWVDTKIKAGDSWKNEIEKALSEASIAILMVSADFMASDFIVDNELPPLLSVAEVKGTKILPVIISPCRFSREPSLNRFQAVNAPNDPLSSLSEDERESIYDRLANDIEESIKSA